MELLLRRSRWEAVGSSGTYARVRVAMGRVRPVAGANGRQQGLDGNPDGQKHSGHEESDRPGDGEGARRRRRDGGGRGGGGRSECGRARGRDS